MNRVQLSKVKFFLAASLATLVGATLFGRPAVAAQTVTVYKTPT